MADLLGQVQRAVAQQVEYVTILMGANDVCASSESAMTPVATFRAQFEQAMAALAAGLPNARVFVASIPDIYKLFAIYRSSFAAQSVWTLAGICQSMLANAWSNLPWDVARRSRVRQRNIDYNTQLAQVCAAYVLVPLRQQRRLQHAVHRAATSRRGTTSTRPWPARRSSQPSPGRRRSTSRPASAASERDEQAAVLVVRGEEVGGDGLVDPGARAEREPLAESPDAPLERERDRVRRRPSLPRSPSASTRSRPISSGSR